MTKEDNEPDCTTEQPVNEQHIASLARAHLSMQFRLSKVENTAGFSDVKKGEIVLSYSLGYVQPQMGRVPNNYIAICPKTGEVRYVKDTGPNSMAI